jgi:hypothetical protein
MTGAGRGRKRVTTIPARAFDGGGHSGGAQVTDLDRLGLALIGFAVAIVVGGMLLGLIGRLIKGGKG